MFLNFIIIFISFYTKPNNYHSIKKIKEYYYNNLLTYDIYNDYNITNNKLLTAEHIFPQCYSKKYLYAKKDMHNIFLTNAETNIYRSNLPFNDINYFNNKKFFVPPEFSRGQIARTLTYMKLIYPLLNINNCINLELLLYWNKKYEPSILEIKRNYYIELYQGNINPFIDNYLLVEEFIKKLL